MSEPYRYKLFDLHTQQYILTNPQDPDSVLIEEVSNSLLDKILPEAARNKLSVATIEEGMTGEMIAKNHPDPSNNVLLLAKGSRGIYGPPEYKELLSPYLDLVRDYPYQRYLTNENVSLHTQKLKIWVVDDEAGISGIEGIDSSVAKNILGDSHGKMSLKLAESVGSPQNLMQYRMIAANSQQAWFAKGTLAPSLQRTLDDFKLGDSEELKDLDLIVPTSSLKGISKQNLQPGLHETEVHLSHHEQSKERNFTLRSVVEKLDGDSLASAIKQQEVEIDKLNQTFATSQALNAEFLKYLEPRTMSDPDNPEIQIDFDPERWEQCGDYKYITFRKDFEGHQQLINSPMFALDKQRFYASRARKAAQLSFVKAKGGMIFSSSELKNNEICIPNLPNGAKVAAIRSPIIKLQDIALVENRIIEDIKNDAGQLIKGAIVCSPQTYESLLFQTKNFIEEQTKLLKAAEVDVSQLESLNPWNSDRYRDAVLSQIEGKERETLTQQLNQWRSQYNDLVVRHQTKAPQLAQIRQDTFTSIIKGDFDGDNIAILSQQQFPAIYAGIEARIEQNDSYTAKLDKIKVTNESELSQLMADKADPYILGKTANLAENLQSMAVAAERVRLMGDETQQLAHLKQIAPSFYYMLANPTAADIKAAEAQKAESTYRYYQISSTGEPLIDPQLVAKFDAYGLDKALLNINSGQKVEPAVRERLFDVWQELLLNVTDAVAQQNQIAVDTFKSERPIDRALVESLTKRYRPLDDGLKKVLKDKETYLSQIPKLNNASTNRALLVNNVTQNLIDYQASSTNYRQIQGLFRAVEDEFVQQEVARISNEYDKLTSLSTKIRAKAGIESGPSLNFVAGDGRAFEVTNILAEGHTVDSLKEVLKSGETNIKIEPIGDPNKSHKFAAFYEVKGNWQPLGTMCNANAQILELNSEDAFVISEANGFRFSSSSAVHLADIYSEQAYRLVEQWRGGIAEERVDDYAAATYNYLTNSSAKSNRLNLMVRAFGPQLAQRTEQLHLNQIKLDSLTGVKPEEKMEVTFTADRENVGKVAVMQVKDDGELVKLGNASYNTHLFAPGTKATVNTSFTAPSIGDLTLDSGEELTVGGMAKSQFVTAGNIFVDEKLEFEVEPGADLSIPVLKVGERVIGRLNEKSAAYLEDAQLLNKGQEIDLSLTTIGIKGGQQIKAVTNNNKVLEIAHLQGEFKTIPRQDEPVKATVDFQTKRNIDLLYAYYQGKRVAIGEFNYGSKGSHRSSLQQLKDKGMYKKLFTAKLNSRVTTMNLEVDVDSVVYDRESEIGNLSAIESSEVNADTDYFLQQQQNYRRYGVIRPRDFITPDGEINRVMALDVMVDRDTVAEGEIPADLAEFELVHNGNTDIEQETKKGFVVYSLPVEQLGLTNRNLLLDRFALARIEDLADNDLARAARYQERLKNNYPDRAEFEANMPGMERLFIPQSSAKENSQQFKPTISQDLLSAIEMKDILPTEMWQQNLDLSYFDYTWLSQTLDLVTDLSREEIIQQAFNADNLAKLKATAAGCLTPEGELVYQHQVAATDARYAKELESTLGKVKYDFYTAKAKSLIAAGQIPVVLHDNGEGKPPAKLITQRPAARIPLPESIDKNLAAPLAIGAGDEFGLALNNPLDYEHPDLAHPVNFDGQNYPSVQHAFGEIVNRDGIPLRQHYALIKNLTIAKFTQHPKIVEEIKNRGGYKWLNSCSYSLEGSDFWSGEGKDSAFIGLLNSSFKQAGAAAKTNAKSGSKKIITLKSGAKRQIKPVAKDSQTAPANLSIKGKPISMNFELKLNGRPNSLPVDNCFDAMRGHGRSHTTRNFQPYKAYGIKEGDLAIAFKGPRDNPTGQVVIKVGKQYRLDRDTINNPEFQQKWAEREKHAPETLPNLFNKEIEAGKEVWGMTFEPVGDLIDGKIVDFATKQKTQQTASTPKPVSKQNEPSNRQEPSTANIQPSADSQIPTDKPELNSDQLAAKTGLLEFLNGDSSSQFATLAGAAGTGKTYLVQQILAEYKAQNPNAVVAFTAPTHAAVRVLENMSARAGVQPDFEGTIYKLLQVTPSIDERTGEQTFIQENQKYAGEKIKPDLIVLDEGSMVGKDLYHFLQEAIAANTKVLVMGDRAQLPPVNEVISPVFSDPAIESKFELKQIMRYDGDLVTTNDSLRQSIEKIMAAEKFDDLKPYLNGFNLSSTKDGQINAMKGNDWESSTTAMFTSPEFQKDSNYVKAVAYRNVRVKELNQKIRTALHGDNIPQFVPGDLIITTAPSPIFNSFDTLLNSTSLKVQEAVLTKDHTTGYDVWLLECETSPTQTETIEVVANSSLNRYQSDLQQKWQLALKEPRGSTARTQAFRNFYEHKQRFASVDHNYAITAHRAQGSTYQHVAVDHNDLRVRLKHAFGAKDFNAAKQALKEYHQLLYVAGTRAKSAVLVADDRIKLDLQPISQTKPAPAPPIQKNNIVAMINVPNLDRAVSDYQVAKANLAGDGQVNLKQSVAEALNQAKCQSQLLDSIKTWNNKTGEQINTNSLIANFKDAPSNEVLKYRAALLGRETDQKAVVVFREDANGTDSLYSVNVAHHVNEYELRSKLKELAISSFTFIPTPDYTKVVISDRGGQLLPAVTQLAKTYDTQLKITQGQSELLRSVDFDSTIKSFDAQNRGISSPGHSNRSDQPRRPSEPKIHHPLRRNGGGVNPRPQKIVPALKQALPKIDSPATVQNKLTQAAIPILRELLEHSPGKRQYTDGNIVVSYDDSSKTISLVDLNSQSLKMAATHDGTQWQSNSQCIGGMRDNDIPFLQAALVIAKSRVEAQDAQPSTPTVESTLSSSLFAENLEQQANQTVPVNYESKGVER